MIYLSDLLKEWRTNKFLNQAEASKIIGINVRTYCLLENGKIKFSPRTINKWLSVMNREEKAKFYKVYELCKKEIEF